MKTAHLARKFKPCQTKTYGPIEQRIHAVHDDKWLTPREAANYLGVGYKRLLNMSSSGQIPYRKLGRLNRYLRRELDLLLEKERRGPLL